MPYVSSTVISGPPDAAIKMVRDALVANAFTVTKATATEFAATGPGMMGSNQSALLGVSKVSFRAEAGVLHVEADLGGAKRLGLFTMLFPPLLGLILVGILSATGRPNSILAPALAVSPWIVVGPLMAFWIRKRTEKAINALLQSTAAISEIAA